jgi:hypothetical protein
MKAARAYGVLAGLTSWLRSAGWFGPPPVRRGSTIAEGSRHGAMTTGRFSRACLSQPGCAATGRHPPCRLPGNRCRKGADGLVPAEPPGLHLCFKASATRLKAVGRSGAVPRAARLRPGACHPACVERRRGAIQEPVLRPWRNGQLRGELSLALRPSRVGPTE